MLQLDVILQKALPQDIWDKFSSFRYKTVDSYEEPVMLVSLRGRRAAVAILK